MTRKTLDYYLKLPYSISINPSPEGGYGIAIPDLPGCISQCETMDEALGMIEDAKLVWLESALEDGIEIPEPGNGDVEDYSGKFSLRLPKSLHKDLAEQAKKENVSLNQLALYHLSRGVGFRKSGL